jgi:archaeal flagellar protein FlaJ
MIKLNKTHIIGICAGLATFVLDCSIWWNTSLFSFVLGIGLVIAVAPFIASVMIETEKEKEKEQMFLEFARNLVESVKSGTPVSRSIVNVKDKDYGSLSPHIEKLSNQISLGIPVKSALETFALDVNIRTISRAVVLISEAEQAGGDIATILEAVAMSVSQTEKLKKERKAAISTLVVQGYIIFLIFIVIMLVMEFKILPMTTSFDLGNAGDSSSGANDLGMGDIGFSPGTISPEELSAPFLYLLLTQGLFAGLVIGKLAEGRLLAGVKHSFILVLLSLLISTGAKAFIPAS